MRHMMSYVSCFLHYLLPSLENETEFKQRYLWQSENNLPYHCFFQISQRCFILDNSSLQVVIITRKKITRFQQLYRQELLSEGFQGGSVVKNPPANVGGAGNASLIFELGRSPGGGNGNPLQYLCLKNSMDRGAQWATIHGVTKSWTLLK